MAGHRKPTGKPLRSAARLRNRRDALDQRMLASTVVTQRASAAFDYFRGALHISRNPQAEAIGREGIDHLIALADRLLEIESEVS